MNANSNMKLSHKMAIVLKPPGPEYELATAPFRESMEQLVTIMGTVVDKNGPLSRVPDFRNYSVYCRWPIRQLEYSFAISHLPAEPNGRVLDIGSGVTPLPYVPAARGWPVTSIDQQIEQVNAMRLHGADTFGSQVDHRVADSRGMGFRDGWFSLITCISVLEHLKHADVPVALAEMVRVCRPGGRIILTFDVFPSDYVHPINGESAFYADKLELIFRPMATACGLEDKLTSALDSVRRLRSQDLDAFWTPHWQLGLWEPKNRGYGALGLVFDLPQDPALCQALVGELKTTALKLEFLPPADVHQEQMADGEKLWIAGDSVLTNMLAQNNFEADVHSFFEHYLRPGDVVLDVGASVGLYALLFSHIVGPAGEVHAFEPTGNTFDCLVRNTLNAGYHIRLNRFGLSQENGPLTLLHGGQDNNAFNSFGQPFGPAATRDGIYKAESVWVSTLDNYVHDYNVGRIDLIKIDVEGWEERVLRGGITTLLEKTPVLVLEYCSPAAGHANSSCAANSHLLNALGYGLFRYQPSSRTLDSVEVDKGMWQFANLVAIRRESLPAVIQRLRGEVSAGVIRAAPGGEQSVSKFDVNERILLLEENRSLRQRLMAGIIDADVASLICQLHISDSDRDARLQVIEELQIKLNASEADRAARLQVIEVLQIKLNASEADRAARLSVIERLDAEVKQLHTQIGEIEADRAARLKVIEELKEELKANKRGIIGFLLRIKLSRSKRQRRNDLLLP